VTSQLVSLWRLDPAAYRPHALHTAARSYTETNCYADIWIELVHARGVEAASMFAFTVTVDFEGDQWTFFKPPAEDLERLYGIDVHEMQLYRPVTEHVVEQLRHGRSVIIEVDAWYLPDTVTTSYHRDHVKTSIAIEAIDPGGGRLRYFHGAGYWQLDNDDYRGVFRLGRRFSDDVLAPYTEIVRFDAGPPLAGQALRNEARRQLVRHLTRRPSTNPLQRFGERIGDDLPGLLAGDAGAYHAYAFATVRQFGAAFECAASFLRWLDGDDPIVADAAAAYEEIVAGSKTLLFKLARQRPFDPSEAVTTMANGWQTAGQLLDQVYRS
jgi:hypothetical protein